MKAQTELTKTEIKTARRFAKRSARFGPDADSAVMQALREILWRSFHTESGNSGEVEAAKEILPLVLLEKRILATERKPLADVGRLTVGQQQHLVREMFGELPPPPAGDPAAFDPSDTAGASNEAPEQ